MHQRKTEGFTLIELMVVLCIMGMLAALGTPAYRSYTQRAAMVDLLQRVLPYQMGVELFFLEQGGGGQCRAGAQGIPPPFKKNAEQRGYVKAITVAPSGQIVLEGEALLEGLTVIFQPEVLSGEIVWKKQCRTEDPELLSGCQRIFRIFPVEPVDVTSRS